MSLNKVDVCKTLSNFKFYMNEIVLDLTKFNPEIQDALKSRAIREGKPMKALLVEIIENKTDAILAAVGDARNPPPRMLA